MRFGENLKVIRKSKNISQEDLAENLGVSRQSVSKWETGENYPSMQNIVCLCTIFKCKMNDLVHEDFEDLDLLGEEVKMSVVKLNEKEQKKMKTLSKILYLFGRIGKVVMRVAMVFAIIAMIVFPILFAKIEVKNDALVYDNSALEIKETGRGVDIVIKDAENVHVANLNNEDIETFKEVLVKRNKYVTIGLFEVGFIVLLVSLYLISVLLNYLDKLFTNIYNGDTPFTLDNVNYIKKMAYIMIACIILPSVGAVCINLAIMKSVDLNIELFNILEIIFLYVMSLIFEYGYRIQQDSKGKMYGKEEKD